MSKLWLQYIKEFGAYLKLERSLSAHSIEAYKHDVQRLALFLGDKSRPENVSLDQLNAFVQDLFEFGLSDRTQARVISGIKAFFKYLLMEDVIAESPAYLLEGPKLSRKLPDTLSFEEIEQLIQSIDHSKPEGTRNHAIIEVLYGCGLRVTELVELRISNLFMDIGYIRVIGKGDKERLVPIGGDAIKYIQIYQDSVRSHMNIQPGNEDILFLNRRGKKLTRVMVFTVVKEATRRAGIKKNVSPHTFRHSFATHMIEGGADLRAVQTMLGHESITTTEIYTHLDRDFLRSTIISYHPRYRKKDGDE